MGHRRETRFFRDTTQDEEPTDTAEDDEDVPTGFPTEEERQEIEETADVGDDTEDTRPDSSLEDLVGTADPQEFDRNFLVEKTDLPIGVGEELPILFPFEGIPRAAVVFNFNYVYNEETGRWERQGPFEPGGPEVVASGTATVPGGNTESVLLGLNDYDLGGDVLTADVSGNSTDPGNAVLFDPDAEGVAGDFLNFYLSWQDAFQDYQLSISNSYGFAINVAYVVRRISPD